MYVHSTPLACNIEQLLTDKYTNVQCTCIHMYMYIHTNTDMTLTHTTSLYKRCRRCEENYMYIVYMYTTYMLYIHMY